MLVAWQNKGNSDQCVLQFLVHCLYDVFCFYYPRDHNFLLCVSAHFQSILSTFNGVAENEDALETNGWKSRRKKAHQSNGVEPNSSQFAVYDEKQLRTDLVHYRSITGRQGTSQLSQRKATARQLCLL